MYSRNEEILDDLQRLVLADLHGPLGGDDEEFSGDNPIDRYPLGRLAPRGVVLEPDTRDDLAAADAGDANEIDPEPSAPNVPSLNPSDSLRDVEPAIPLLLQPPGGYLSTELPIGPPDPPDTPLGAGGTA